MPPSNPPLVHRAWRSAAFRLQRYAANADRRALDEHLTRLNLEKVKGIHTWTTKSELESLYRLASQCKEGANIVELGSYLGASTCYLAAGAELVGGHVTAIDLWNNETIVGGHRDTFAEFKDNISSVSHLVTVVRKHTRDLTAEDVRPPIDFAFIDADHSYEATKADAAFIAPFIAPDGVIAFHDTTTFAGVSRALAELLLSGDWCLGGKADSLTWLRRAKWMPWPPVANGAGAPK